jgi:hypothetical protein
MTTTKYILFIYRQNFAALFLNDIDGYTLSSFLFFIFAGFQRVGAHQHIEPETTQPHRVSAKHIAYKMLVDHPQTAECKPWLYYQLTGKISAGQATWA